MPDGSAELKVGYVRFDVTAGAPRAMWEGVFAEKAGEGDADRSAVTATGRLAEVASTTSVPLDATWMVVPQVDRLLEAAREQRGAKMLATRYLPPKPGSAAAATTATIVAGADALSPANPYRSLVQYYALKREEEAAARQAAREAAGGGSGAGGGGRSKVRIKEPSPEAHDGGGGGESDVVTEDEAEGVVPPPPPKPLPAAPAPAGAGGAAGKSALKKR